MLEVTLDTGWALIVLLASVDRVRNAEEGITGLDLQPNRTNRASNPNVLRLRAIAKQVIECRRKMFAASEHGETASSACRRGWRH